MSRSRNYRTKSRNYQTTSYIRGTQPVTQVSCIQLRAEWRASLLMCTHFYDLPKLEYNGRRDNLIYVYYKHRLVNSHSYFQYPLLPILFFVGS